MDIHRCRFVPYPPPAINALAFSHPSSASGKAPPNLRLAIGRANGDLEIWNPSRGAWYQEKILKGGRDRSIEGLIWTQDPEDVDKRGYSIPGRLRLFSIGYSTAVTEWDLALGRPARHCSGNYGEIWCMAAQPKAPTPKKAASDARDGSAKESVAEPQCIAAGCADGSIILLSTADGDLRYMRSMARPSKKSARVLSLTFQDQHTIVAGHADSTIRIYDIRNGQQIRNMTLGGGPKGGPKETLVWSVKCLSNGTIVSGDSTGTVSFWDAKNHSLSQRLHSHNADILDIAVSMDGKSIFSGGMDRRTVLYQRTGEKGRWAKISHTRLHDNDVKVLATFESKRMSILASGGLDTQPIIVPIQEFGREHHRALPSLPQDPPLCSAPKKRLIVTWWDHEVNIWAVARRRNGLSEIQRKSESSEENARKLVAKVALQGDDAITSVDIASDGTLLVISTIAEVKVFRLRPRDGVLKVRKMDIPPNMANTGAKLVKFSSDQRWLCLIRPNDCVYIYRLHRMDDRYNPTFSEEMIHLRRLTKQPGMTNYLNGSLGNYDRNINRIAFSADGRILAVSDIAGYLDTWVLEGHEDLTQSEDQQAAKHTPSSSEDSDSDENADSGTFIFGERWIRNPVASLLPKLPSTPLILAFRPSVAQHSKLLTNGNTPIHPTRHNPHPHSHDLPNGEDRLLVLTAESQLVEFNILIGKMTDWSRRNPKSRLPQSFRDLRDRAKGVVWDVQNHNERIWLYSVNWLWMFDLSRDLPAVEEIPSHQKSDDQVVAVINGNGQLKRKRDSERPTVQGSRPRGRDTGAGSKVPDDELSMGIGRRIRRISGTDPSGDKMIHVDHDPQPDTDDEDDYALANEHSTPLPLRRQIENGHHDDSGVPDAIESEDGPISNNDDQRLVGTEGKGRLPYWCTYKYRPILGIVPLESMDGDDVFDDEGMEGSMPRGVEVALVERPLWDVDLPPRYHGDQEWDS